MGATRGRKQSSLRAIINKEIDPKERIKLVGELARGVSVKEGSGVVYTKPPDLAALRFLEEYATGKPVGTLETPLGESAFACILIPQQKKK